MWEGSVVVGADVEFVEVLEQKRPLGGVKLWRRLLRRLDSEALLMLRCGCKCTIKLEDMSRPTCMSPISFSFLDFFFFSFGVVSTSIVIL